MAEEGISPQAEETETIDTITLNELEANEQIQGTDLILTRDEQGRDRKATMQEVKDFSYPPDASASQAGLINTENQSFTGVKTFENGIEVGNITKNGNAILTQPETEQLIQVTKSELEEMINTAAKNAAEYKSGDSFVISGTIVCAAGYVTTDSTNLRITLFLPKTIPSNAVVNSLKMNIRAAAGSIHGYVGKNANPAYVEGGVDYTNLIANISCNNNLITIRLNLSTRWYLGSVNTNNNYPIVAEINQCNISFN